MLSSLAKSWNKMIDQARHMPITSMIDAIRIKTMKDMADMRLVCKKWKDVLCLEMYGRLQASLDVGRTWRVSSASEDLFEVHCEPSMLVNVALRICSCGKWQQDGFPCSHAATVINCCSHLSGKDLMEYIEPYFYTHFYQLALSGIIHPVVTFGRLDNEICIFPPVTKKQPGMPKKKRIPSRGEFLRVIRCGRCGKKGRHNRKSCREVISS